MGTFKNGVHCETKPGRFASILREAVSEERPISVEIRHDGFSAVNALYEAVNTGTVRVLDEITGLLTAIVLTKAWPGNKHLMLAIWPTDRLHPRAFLTACASDLISLQWREREHKG